MQRYYLLTFFLPFFFVGSLVLAKEKNTQTSVEKRIDKVILSLKTSSNFSKRIVTFSKFRNQILSLEKNSPHQDYIFLFGLQMALELLNTDNIQKNYTKYGHCLQSETDLKDFFLKSARAPAQAPPYLSQAFRILRATCQK